MIRNITKEDIPCLIEISSLSELGTMTDIDFSHSAVSYSVNGNINAFILTRMNPIINAFKDRKIPRKFWQMFRYTNTEDGNHEAICFFRTDKNGVALCETMSYLRNQNQSYAVWWWYNEQSPLITKDNSNKMESSFCVHITNTPIHCALI